MEYMESHRLLKDHTFQLKETLKIRIAEEANLRLIKGKTIRSNSNNLIVAGRKSMHVQHILFSMVGTLQKHAAEKVTIDSTKLQGHRTEGSLNSLQVQVGQSCASERS
jgi:hypothetical protein